MLIFVPAMFSGSLMGSGIEPTEVVGAVRNTSVEVVLPEGGRGLQLSCSGWSAVLGSDADGGTPDLDFTDEGDARVAARRCPYRLFAATAGAISDLICKANNELRPLCQVLTPNVMIMKGRRYAGEPR